MPCFTRITMKLDDTQLNRRARIALGLNPEGPLGETYIRQVRVEAGIIKAQDQLRRLAPTAMVRRNGTELTVSVNL